MISEAPPQVAGDYFYEQSNPFYAQTTVQAFNDAGLRVSSMKDVLNLGVYVTTAIKWRENCVPYILQKPQRIAAFEYCRKKWICFPESTLSFLWETLL
jgi:hypothetical protein